MRATFLAIATFAVLASTAADAGAADVQACLQSSEKGQRARSAGKLREAREHFLVCGGEGCPSIVRRDCAQWTSELTTALPTVVFGARDKSGRDLLDVTVTMDGETVVKKLDGKAVFIDPGPHTFRFETAGAAPVDQTFLVKEGEKSRVINVTFAGGESASAARTTPTDASSDNPSEGGHSVLPWIIVGVGAAAVVTGVVIVATAPTRPGNCDADTQTCARLDGQSEADFKADQEQAGKADSQPVLGWAITGIGAAFVVGGLLWHFLEPTTETKTSTARVVPWTAGSASGVAVGGTF